MIEPQGLIHSHHPSILFHSHFFSNGPIKPEQTLTVGDTLMSIITTVTLCQGLSKPGLLDCSQVDHVLSRNRMLDLEQDEC